VLALPRLRALSHTANLTAANYAKEPSDRTLATRLRVPAKAILRDPAEGFRSLFEDGKFGLEDRDLRTVWHPRKPIS
jgi:hypothetical protein